ncbi:DUF6476 family protein [Breoghania sp.]|uniref:DUF6476 family protein n=1 Tax=Breoghania sp. TaxID=2065378 RepID=UPI002AA852FB|nr:DUF6476 family protein [Breoghania sp.]
MEKVQAKLKRLLLFSFLIMVAGLVAVFSALVYKMSSKDAKPEAIAGPEMAATIAIGEGASVLQTQIDGNHLFVLVEEEKGRALLQFDAKTGRLVGRTDLVAR